MLNVSYCMAILLITTERKVNNMIDRIRIILIKVSVMLALAIAIFSVSALDDPVYGMKCLAVFAVCMIWLAIVGYANGAFDID